MSRGPSKAVAALLSATETVIPGLKRENSDSLNLTAVPRKKSDYGLLRDKSTNILSRSSSFSATTNDDAKSRKKSILDAELQEAISALRKPNRQLAGQSAVEAAERRTSCGGLSQLKKSRKPMRLSSSTGGVVKATPIGNRFRQTESQPVRPFASLLPHSDGLVPPSSASVIPATQPRSGFRDALGPSSAERVAATPSVVKIRVVGSPHQSRVGQAIFDTPTAGLVAATPVKKRFGAGLSSTPVDAVSATPVRSIRDMFLTPVKPKGAGAFPAGDDGKDQGSVAPIVPLGETKKAASVYERLGWDDEFDD
jgi:DNA replication regulator SLD3